MTPPELETELIARGLQVLAVSYQPLTNGVAVVYLHGNSGQSANGYALEVVASVPGVTRVEESIRTRAIILAWLE